MPIRVEIVGDICTGMCVVDRRKRTDVKNKGMADRGVEVALAVDPVKFFIPFTKLVMGIEWEEALHAWVPSNDS